MAIYGINGASLMLTELQLYGSSRVGIWNRKINADLPKDADSDVKMLGPCVGNFRGIMGRLLTEMKLLEIQQHIIKFLRPFQQQKVDLNNKPLYANETIFSILYYAGYIYDIMQ